MAAARSAKEGDGPAGTGAADEDCGSLLTDCRCRPAVERAFSGMVASGSSEMIALDVAARVYRHHHPRVSTRQARDVVEVWVYRGTFH
jgi:hypothetical protein